MCDFIQFIQKTCLFLVLCQWIKTSVYRCFWNRDYTNMIRLLSLLVPGFKDLDFFQTSITVVIRYNNYKTFVADIKKLERNNKLD